MSVPKIVKGQYFSVGVFSPAGATSPVLICGLTARNLTHQVNTSDEYIRDCQDPDDVPVRVVNVTGEQFDISGTGLYDRSQGALIRSLVGKSMKYRYVQGEPADDAVFSGYYEGNFILTNFQQGAPDVNNVTSQFTWVSDGPIIWVDGATIIDLDPLVLALTTVAAGAAYSGTITGRVAGSTIAATSSDGTALTVTGNVVGGTFAAAGRKTITLTETLASAVNSPKITTVVVTVN